MIFTIDADDDERRDQVNEWFDASTRDRIAEALLDENGLRPTDAALDVIMAVIESTDGTNQDFVGDDSAVPGIWRYGKDAERALTELRLENP